MLASQLVVLLVFVLASVSVAASVPSVWVIDSWVCGLRTASSVQTSGLMSVPQMAAPLGYASARQLGALVGEWVSESVGEWVSESVCE